MRWNITDYVIKTWLVKRAKQRFVGSVGQIVAYQESILIVGDSKRIEFPSADALHAEFGSFLDTSIVYWFRKSSWFGRPKSPQVGEEDDNLIWRYL